MPRDDSEQILITRASELLNHHRKSCWNLFESNMKTTYVSGFLLFQPTCGILLSIFILNIKKVFTFCLFLVVGGGGCCKCSYESSQSGYSPKSKMTEFFHQQSRFLLSLGDDESLSGFLMWRFDWEETISKDEEGGMIEVAYWCVYIFLIFATFFQPGFAH